MIVYILALVLWLISVVHQEHVSVTPAAVPTLTPAPTATATPVVQPDVRAVVCAPQYAWDCDTAVRIVLCESGGNPLAVGRAGERSWWQIHPIHAGSFDWERAFDPYVNTAFAYRLYLARGWQPWVACSAGSY